VVEAVGLEAVVLVVVGLEAADFAEAPHLFEWEVLGQVERHLAELVLLE